MTVIALCPLGSCDASLLPRLAPIVREAFGHEVQIAAGAPLPPHALDDHRGQYRSDALLDALAAARQPGWERLLGVADVDLFTPGLNFVFGQADRARRVAVMSIHRLTGGRTAASSLLQLAATEAVHELGHTYGLAHCDDPRCVMWFSNTLAETVRKGHHFCQRHADELRARH